jgi:hypothetical protein
MTKSLAIVLMLISATSTVAADIPKDCRVANIPPGYCCWASLETLGKVHGISSLNGLLESRTKESDTITIIQGGSIRLVEPKNYGYDHAIRAKLTTLKVKFWMNETGSSDRSLLKYANSHGCLVGLKAGARGELGHGIVLTHYDDKIIRFYDSNQPDDTWEGSREWFDFWWSGMIVVVEK